MSIIRTLIEKLFRKTTRRSKDSASSVEPSQSFVGIVKQEDSATKNYFEGCNLRKVGKHEESLLHFDKALQLDPRLAEAWNDKGNSLRDLGRFEEAFVCYLRATEIKPGLSGPWTNIGNVLIDLEKYEEACEMFDMVIDGATRQRERGIAMIGKGIALRKSRKYEEALHCYDSISGLPEESTNILFNKGLVLIDMGRKKEAIECFNQHLEYYPEDAQAKALRDDLMN